MKKAGSFKLSLQKTGLVLEAVPHHKTFAPLARYLGKTEKKQALLVALNRVAKNLEENLNDGKNAAFLGMVRDTIGHIKRNTRKSEPTMENLVIDRGRIIVRNPLAGKKSEMIEDVKHPPITEKEKRIFDVLMRAAKKTGSVVRVAGGWVRDKILGKENHDIDITIDNMTGAQFARVVAEEIGKDPDDISVIKQNPEQSKHLETATMSIEGLPIDMVNLRSETYADTRVPEMQMGTAETDATRRDLTINSMFYNLVTGEMEDITGQGVEDLKNGIIRTPLDGLQTFIDDPLRTLRAVRFAARFGFEIAPETLEAMSDPRVHNAFQDKKISIERIRDEFNGALLNDPARSVRLLLKTGLVDLFMPELRALDMDQKSPHHDKTVLDHTLHALETVHKHDPGNLPLKLATLMHDIAKPVVAKKKESNPDQLVFHQHEGKGRELSQSILVRMKYSNEIKDLVSRLVANHMIKPDVAKYGELKFNTWLRNLVKTPNELRDLMLLNRADIKASARESAVQGLVGLRKILNRLRKIDVSKILTMRPYVDGDELQQLFGRKGGKWLGKVHEQLLMMQLDGKIKDRDEALAYLAKKTLADDGTLIKKTEAGEA